MGVGVHWREHVNFTTIQTLTLTIGMFAIIFSEADPGLSQGKLHNYVVHTGISLSYSITHVFLFLVTFHFFIFCTLRHSFKVSLPVYVQQAGAAQVIRYALMDCRCFVDFI